MEEYVNIIESLYEKAAECGKTSFELIKLKAVDKISNVASSIISHGFILMVFGILMLFLNLGIAFWLGEFFGKLFYGFFAVAAFYFILFILLFLLNKSIKKSIQNYLIKQVLK